MTEVRPEKGAWSIVALLFCFMLINFADKAIVGLAGVPIMTELNLTPRQFGLVGSSFFLLFSISAVVTGFVVNRVRSKWVLLAMGLTWALVQFPLLGTVGIEVLIACRIVLGAGEGPAYPMALHTAYKWFPDKKRAIPTAIISLGAASGVVIAIPLLNSIITSYNWHYAFGALGMIGLVWVILWAVLGKEGRIEDPGTGGSTAIAPALYRDLLVNPTSMASWCAYFSAYFGLALVLSWFTPFLVKGLGFDQILAGKLTALPFLVSFFCPAPRKLVIAAYDAERGEQSSSSRYFLWHCDLSWGACSRRNTLCAEYDGDYSFDRCRDDPSRYGLHTFSGHP